MNYFGVNENFGQTIGVLPDVFWKYRVAIELPASQAHRPDAIAAFMFAANQAARLFSQLWIVAPDARVPLNAWGVRRVSDLVEVLRRISGGSVQWSTTPTVDVVLGVGAPPSTQAPRSIAVYFSGFHAALDRPLEGEPMSGVFGGMFAACYGIAQCLVHVAQLAGGPHRLIEPFRLSLLGYDDSAVNASLPSRIDLGDVHLVGIGAVGSAAIYALAQLEGLSGNIYAIDNDVVDERNLNRYVLMQESDIGHTKVDVARDALADAGLAVVPHFGTFKDYRRSAPGPLDLLLTPVDSEAARRDLASELPREVLNAATGGSTVTISRHGFANGRACLNCLYQPEPQERTTEQVIASDLGLDAIAIEAMLSDNVLVSADVVRGIERHRGVEQGSYAIYERQPIQTFYQQAVCGAAAVTTAAGTVVSPLSFISATAGVLLACELIKLRSPELRQFSVDNYFRLDTLAAPNPQFRQIKPQRASCQRCNDPTYIEVYRRRYL